MITTLKLGAGLLLLIISNIAIGSINAIANKQWNKEKFWKGVIKGAIVIAVCAAMYLAGWLNPDLVVMEINDETMSLLMGINLLLVGGFSCYAAKVIVKLKEIMLPSKNEPQEESKTPSTAQDSMASEAEEKEHGDFTQDNSQADLSV